MKQLLSIALMVLLYYYAAGQDFENGDLEGSVSGIATTPPNWSAIPLSDPANEANFGPGATPDLTNVSGPYAEIGLLGNPYSGNSFISAIRANSNGSVYMEGIQQSVHGFTPDSIYEIHFYQSVVKQYNMEDNTGAWEVYVDDELVGISDPSTSYAPYNSTSFNWDKRSIVFTASSTIHMIKFFAHDNDANGVIDEYDASGAIRVGIDSLFITPWCNLNANLGPDTLLCAGDSLLLDVTSANAEYAWQDGSSDPTFTVTEPGTYSVTVSNVCGVLSDQVTIDYDYSVQDLDLGDDLILCDGDTFELVIEQDTLNYLWQDGSTENSLEISQNGYYWVEMSSANCSNNDTLMAFFNPLPAIDFPSDTMLCEGAGLMIQAELQNATYEWSDNSTSPNFVIYQPGSYWVNVSENGCTAHREVHVEYIPIPNIRLPHDTLLCLGQRLRLNVNQQYSDVLWQDYSTAPNYDVTEPGVYFAEVYNECGYDSATVTVDYSECECFIYIPNSFTPNGDGRNDQFKVEYDCFFDAFTLDIFDRWGQLLFHSNDPNASWDGYNEGKQVPLGVYLYQLKYDSYGIEPVEKYGSITLLH